MTHILHEGLRQPLGEEGQKKMAKLLTAELAKRTCNEYVLIVALRQLGYPIPTSTQSNCNRLLILSVHSLTHSCVARSFSILGKEPRCYGVSSRLHWVTCCRTRQPAFVYVYLPLLHTHSRSQVAYQSPIVR